ncbi:hypothetical protein HanPI659440_Chr09g0318681 [Helianthus annuus]|nr:hypothetical protein HanPI659440_Chr09g0318681 [Helianthus annuus]
MSSSIFASNSIVLATAMVAVSGTVILLAFRHHKPPTTTAAAAVAVAGKFTTTHHPRPCISIDGKERVVCKYTYGKKRVKKKKKVRFAEDVMEPSGSGEEFRKRFKNKNLQKLRTSSSICKDEGGKRKINMPENRVALYTGILRERNVHRFAC